MTRKWTCIKFDIFCRAKKIYEIVNKQVKILTSQYVGTFASDYTKGYALN